FCFALEDFRHLDQKLELMKNTMSNVNQIGSPKSMKLVPMTIADIIPDCDNDLARYAAYPIRPLPTKPISSRSHHSDTIATILYCLFSILATAILHDWLLRSR